MKKDKEKSPVDEVLESYGIDPKTIPPIEEFLEKTGQTMEEFRKKISISLPPLEEED